MRFVLSILFALTTTPLGVAPSSASAAERARPSIVITIRGGTFTPAKLTLRTGDTVVWTNGDDRDHTVTAIGGAFDSGNIRPGGTFAWRAAKAGEFSYGCSLHPRMRGVISVQ